MYVSKSVFSLLLLALVFASAASASTEHARVLADYAHRAWTANEGAPTQIHAIRQTPDGFLWLSTSTGLYRFDGLSFQQKNEIGGQPLRSSTVLAMDSSPDGALWIGYRFGDVSRFKDGKVQHFDAESGYPGGMPITFATAPDGVWWSTTIAGLAWFDGKRWHQVGSDTGFSPTGNSVRQVAFDQAGVQWVATTHGAYFRRPGERRYHIASPDNVTLSSLDVGPDGTVWGCDGVNSCYRITAAEKPFSRPAGPPDIAAKSLHFGPDRTMWLMLQDGVGRKLSDGAPDPRQRVTREQGLSGVVSDCFFVDRDGNIWMGTPTGLDLFRRNRVTPLPTTLDLLEPALVADTRGTVWAATGDGIAYRLDANGRRSGKVDMEFVAAAVGANGHAALGTARGIWIAGDAGGRLIPSPAAAFNSNPQIRNLAQDRDGAWWASYIGAGIFRYRDGIWRSAHDLFPTLPATRPMAMYGDKEGRVWIGYLQNTVALIEAGVVKLLGAAQGLNIGNVVCIVERNGHVWFAGDTGVARYDGGHFIPLRLADGRELRGISGVVETAAGELWLNGYDGAFHIASADVDSFVRTGAPVSYERLGREDGVSTAVSPIGPFPTMVEATDGKLWLANDSGPVLIDPQRIKRNGRAPTVEIGAVESDGKQYLSAGEVRLPQGASNLHINFTAASLAAPSRTAFRYRLDGVDKDWVSSNGRREAFYTNLQPGTYHFQVFASNEDGVWNTLGAQRNIVIPPTFWQSLLFKFICALVAIAIFSVAYRWRLAQMARLIEARHLERVSERERIARALHDTFLGEAQGTIFMLQAAIEEVPTAMPARAALERGLSYIEQALLEGRHEVMSLRGETEAEGRSLSGSLAHFGERMALGRSVSFCTQFDGDGDVLWTAATEEVFAIGREAICNAFLHASATEVWLIIDGQADGYTMTVRDNGKGYAPDVLMVGGVHGHWGLIGIRERAARIGAHLEMGNNADGGAMLKLTVPGKDMGMNMGINKAA